MANDSELDCILFDYRGLKFTFRIAPLEQDANGEIIEDIYFEEDGTNRSQRFNRLIEYGNIAADFLDAERAKGGLLQNAHQHATPEPAGVPVMGQRPQGGTPTGYRPAPQQDEGCSVCGGELGPPKQTSRGQVRECLQQYGTCVNDKGYPTSKWLPQHGGRR